VSITPVAGSTSGGVPPGRAGGLEGPGPVSGNAALTGAVVGVDCVTLATWLVGVKVGGLTAATVLVAVACAAVVAVAVAPPPPGVFVGAGIEVLVGTGVLVYGV
jgi:hypothetical protein